MKPLLTRLEIDMTTSVLPLMAKPGNGAGSSPSIGTHSGGIAVLPRLPREDHGEGLYLGVRLVERAATTPGDAQLTTTVGDLFLVVSERPPMPPYGQAFAFFPIGEELFGRSESGRRLALDGVDLVALPVTEPLPAERSAPSDTGSAMLTRIHAYIEKGLKDPGLSPKSIARAHCISVRYLHKLFQKEGITVSRHIRERRLAACCRELSVPPNRRRTVAAVAHTWGFASHSHFSRVFRRTFGIAPSQWQAAQPGPARSFPRS